MVPGDNHPGGLPRKHFTPMAILGFSLAILNSSTAASGSLSTVLPSGGPVAVVYGMIASWLGIVCMGLSLAEIAAVLPLWSGVYAWAYLLCAPPGVQYARRRIALSYITAWINGAAWMAVTASASSIFSQFVTGIISLYNPSYDPQNWQVFLIYLGLTIAAWCINVFGVKLLDLINKAALLWMLAGVTVMSIVCLACSSGKFQSGHFVFAHFVNETGWPDGVAWILGLLQSAFSLTGIDGVTHICEELDNPSKYLPMTIVLAVCMGASLSLVLLIVFLFCLTDYDQVVNSATGPLLQILYQATRSRAGAVCLNMFPLLSMCFAGTSILTAASRVVHALAHDQALFLHRVWQWESKTLHTPVAAISFTSFWVIVFGCIYLGSNAALQAILSSSVVNFQISYMIPVTIILLRGRKILDAFVPPGTKRPWDLGPIFGPVVNTIALCFNLTTTVFFFFPNDVPTTTESMNWTVVVEGVILLLCGLTWIFEARKVFSGPQTIHPEIMEIATGVRPSNQRALPYPYHDFSEKHIVTTEPADPVPFDEEASNEKEPN